MLATILRPIEEDLNKVYDLMDREMAYITRHAGELHWFGQLPTRMALRPALVILSSGMYGGNPEQTRVLATVFQFIFLASYTHDSLSEDFAGVTAKENGISARDRFMILLGDFFYSRASVIILESGIKGMLSPLAEIVSLMQEGCIEKNRLAGDSLDPKKLRDAIRKETAELMAGCCRLGACLAGTTAEDQENMDTFGRNLGMAYGLSKMGAPIDQIVYYGDKGHKALQQMPLKPERIILEQLIKLISCGDVEMQRLVG